MFEFLSFELIVHDSAGGVVFRVVTWIITVIIGAVPALCPRCAKTPPKCCLIAVVTEVPFARSIGGLPGKSSRKNNAQWKPIVYWAGATCHVGGPGKEVIPFVRPAAVVRPVPCGTMSPRLK